MPSQNEFPHLQLAYRGQFTPRFNGGPRDNVEVDRNLADRAGHTGRLRQVLDEWRVDFENWRDERTARGLPAVPADHGFILRVPEGSDGDAIAYELGVDLVAETSDGLILVATNDVTLPKLREVLARFASGSGGGQAANLLQVFSGPEDGRRLDEILAPGVRELWPFLDAQIYILDFAIHSAESTRRVKFPICKRREKQGETVEAFEARREALRQGVRENATDTWQENMEVRFRELSNYITHYQGEILAGPMNDVEQEIGSGLVFPDSFQVRMRINGAGVKDIIRNFAHIFEVSLPTDIAQIESSEGFQITDEGVQLIPPDSDAPVVCIIDSGIQEGHLWLAAAVDSTSSHNFIPGEDISNVADQVPPRGHGTRVAGAVLYPRDIPKTGEIRPVAWLQNARVLNEHCRLPSNLPPERYLAQVVQRFAGGIRATKIFNHSINSNAPSLLRRMSSWAAKMDELSHNEDVLFIQSTGNISSGMGNQASPGLQSHLRSGLSHPEQLFEDSSRIANPAQSLHALTVGSVAHEVFNDGVWQSFASEIGEPAAYSRIGFAPPWAAVKPEVVELGGDFAHSCNPPKQVRLHEKNCVELLSSTMHQQSAHAKDGAGTSFAAPKVAHIAAHLQALFPEAPSLLYRALIVQSARWPSWAEAAQDKDRVLRLIGYGLPSLERATNNPINRVTLITATDRKLAGKQYDLFTVQIPDELRGPAVESRIRVDVTLAYTSEPRRTRARNRSYLETWVDWTSSRQGEPVDDFKERLESGGRSARASYPWTIGNRNNEGEVVGTNRSLGSLQKDWAVFRAHEFPPEFAIAVRAHPGWNHRPDEGLARYCLVVSFEVLEGDLPIYQMIEAEVENQIHT